MQLADVKLSSLFLLCLQRLARLLDSHAAAVTRLPPSLKDALRAVATASGRLRASSLPCLLHGQVRELELGRCDLDRACLEVLQTCSGLTKLDLSCFAGVARSFDCSALASLFPCLPLLTTLNLNYVVSADDGVTEAVTRHCPRITTLYLQGCAAITDVSLHWMPALRHLQVLNISHTKVTDAGMVHLLNACGKQLHKLFIANCANLTRVTFVAVVRNWVCLERLVCDGCPFEDRQLHREIELREREAKRHNSRAASCPARATSEHSEAEETN
ncbi:protein AMN1 homolog [Bacillus rossius redtenbacheri]|uniref:protein AMN1 homolog n=1 Tax=Bacillus rossius redtenbacheri TaxID=93214 RepID=UPI002FDEB3D9